MRVEVAGSAAGSVPAASVVTPRGNCRGVVLVLHGGREVSRQPVARNSSARLRMLPFVWDIGRRVRHRGVAIWQVHYRYRGWNGTEASPVADTRWALAEARQRYGDVPVVLLGHSMGGRVAVHVADDPNVTDLVLLAPWLPAGETVAAVAGRRVLLLHGDQDRTTSLTASEAWAARAARAGADLEVHRIAGGEHTMLRHAGAWQSMAARRVVEALGAREVLRG